jgi:hypothetical protein
MAADSLVTKTLVLANKGNPSAQQVVGALRQQDIAIDLDSPPPAPLPQDSFRFLLPCIVGVPSLPEWACFLTRH